MLQHIDRLIFRFFNDTCHTALLDKAMPYITEIATMGVFLVALILFFFRGRKAAMCGILLMAGLTAAYYVSGFIKDAVARPRPFCVLPDVKLLVKTGGFSMPSSHTAMAFMAAFILTVYFRRWYVYYILAVLVGVSRMYIGVHYPSDVLAGAILGTLLGYVLVRVAERAEAVRGPRGGRA